MLSMLSVGVLVEENVIAFFFLFRCVSPVVVVVVAPVMSLSVVSSMSKGRPRTAANVISEGRHRKC